MDSAWASLMNAWQHPLLTGAMGTVTWFGSLFLLLPLALGMGWRERAEWRRFAFLPLAVLGAAGVAHVLKWLVDRERPDLFPSLIAMPADASFPSAHAMQVTAFVGAWLLWRGDARLLPLLLGCTLVLLVAVSRTYLQVHFFSDVVAGIVAGALWAVVLERLLALKRRD